MAGSHKAKKKSKKPRPAVKKSRVASPARKPKVAVVRKRGALVKRGGGGAGSALGLPSGRLVKVTGGQDGESIEVRSADGSLEVRISLTTDGPVLSLKGVRLQIDAAEGVEVNCRDFAVRAEHSVEVVTGGDLGIRTQGEMRVKAMKQAFIDAEMVNLNCLDRSDYPPPPEMPADSVPRDAVAAPSRECGEPGCDCNLGCDGHK